MLMQRGVRSDGPAMTDEQWTLFNPATTPMQARGETLAVQIRPSAFTVVCEVG